jgi:hypothetical protein
MKKAIGSRGDWTGGFSPGEVCCWKMCVSGRWPFLCGVPTGIVPPEAAGAPGGFHQTHWSGSTSSRGICPLPRTGYYPCQRPASKEGTVPGRSRIPIPVCGCCCKRNMVPVAGTGFLGRGQCRLILFLYAHEGAAGAGYSRTAVFRRTVIIRPGALTGPREENRPAEKIGVAIHQTD